jgi:hypothetical protein
MRQMHTGIGLPWLESPAGILIQHLAERTLDRFSQIWILRKQLVNTTQGTPAKRIRLWEGAFIAFKIFPPIWDGFRFSCILNGMTMRHSEPVPSRQLKQLPRRTCRGFSGRLDNEKTF